MSAPQDHHQLLPHQHHSRASLQLPTALPCPAMDPAELGQHGHEAMSQPRLSPSPPPWLCPTILGPCLPLARCPGWTLDPPITMILSYDLGPWLGLAMISGSAPLPCSAVGLSPGFEPLPGWHEDSWATRSPFLLLLLPDGLVLSLAQAM